MVFIVEFLIILHLSKIIILYENEGNQCFPTLSNRYSPKINKKKKSLKLLNLSIQLKQRIVVSQISSWDMQGKSFGDNILHKQAEKHRSPSPTLVFNHVRIENSAPKTESRLADTALDNILLQISRRKEINGLTSSCLF